METSRVEKKTDHFSAVMLLRFELKSQPVIVYIL